MYALAQCLPYPIHISLNLAYISHSTLGFIISVSLSLVVSCDSLSRDRNALLSATFDRQPSLHFKNMHRNFICESWKEEINELLDTLMIVMITQWIFRFRCVSDVPEGPVKTHIWEQSQSF